MRRPSKSLVVRSLIGAPAFALAAVTLPANIGSVRPSIKAWRELLADVGGSPAQNLVFYGAIVLMLVVVVGPSIGRLIRGAAHDSSAEQLPTHQHHHIYPKQPRLAEMVGRQALAEEVTSAAPELWFPGHAVVARTLTSVQQPGAPFPIPTAASVSASGDFSAMAPSKKVETADYVYVNVGNRAEAKWVDVTAKQATAKLDFFNVHGHQLIPALTARWSDSKNPARQHAFSSPAEYNVWHVGTDKIEPLDIVYKFRDEDCCYVYTNANARHGLRDQATKIVAREFIVRVTVSSVNAPDLVGHFRIKHLGPGQIPSIEAAAEAFVGGPSDH